jgi:hypothetical protein
MPAMARMTAAIFIFAERFRSATRRTMLIRKTDNCSRCAVATG